MSSSGAQPRPVQLRSLKSLPPTLRGPNQILPPCPLTTSKSTSSSPRSSSPSSPPSVYVCRPSTSTPTPNAAPTPSPNVAASNSIQILSLPGTPNIPAGASSPALPSISGSTTSSPITISNTGPAITTSITSANGQVTNAPQPVGAVSTTSSSSLSAGSIIKSLFKRAWSWSKVATVLGVAVLILFEASSWINRNESTEIAKKSLVLAQYTACQENEALQSLPRCKGLNSSIKVALDPVRREAYHAPARTVRNDDEVYQASVFVEQSLRYIRCQLHSYDYVLKALPIASRVSKNDSLSTTFKTLDHAREDVAISTIRWFATINNTHNIAFKLHAAMNAVIKIDELYHPILETRGYHLRHMGDSDPYIVSYYYNRTRYYWERQPALFFLLDARKIYSEGTDIPPQSIQDRAASFFQGVMNFKSYPVHDLGFLLVCHIVLTLMLRIRFPYHTGLFVIPAGSFLDLYILFHFVEEKGHRFPLRRIAKALSTMYSTELASRMLLSRGRRWDIAIAVALAVSSYLFAETHISFPWTLSLWIKSKVFLFFCVDFLPTLGWFPGTASGPSKRELRSRLAVLILWSLILFSYWRIYRALESANDAVNAYKGCYEAW